LKTSPYIDQAVVVGQDQKALGALLVASPDCLEQAIPRERWQEAGAEGVLRGPEVAKLFRAEIDRLLCREAGFRPCERVAAFRVLLQPLTVENGMMTATLKVRRHVVQERLAPLLDELFENSRGRRH